MTVGENGILTRAKNSKKQSTQDMLKEKIENAVLEVQIEEITNAGTLTLQKLYESLETKDSNISLEEYKDGDTVLKGTYTLDGKAYEFTIDENFKVVVGEEAQPKPLSFGEVTWASNKATVTLASKISDSIEYQVNGTTDGSWVQGKQVTNLNNGDIVYARINDGTTITEIQELEIKDEIKPEEFEVTTSDVTYESLKLSGSTVDNQTGLATYSYVAATSSSEIIKEITGQTATEYPITGLDSETEYVVYMLAYDNAGNVRKSNEVTVKTAAMPVARMFGQYVDYEIDIDGNTNDYDWQIFYKEEETSSPNYGATYIIPDYYVPASKMATSLSNAGMSLYQGTYRVYWPSTPTYQTILETVREKFMYDYTGSNNNNRSVSRLLNTDNWKDNFVTSQLQAKGGLAIGGPTINMWCASWNKAYPTQKITPTISGTGYKVNGSNSLSLISYTGYISAPNVYFPTKKQDSDGTNTYCLASPITYTYGDKMIEVFLLGKLSTKGYDGGPFALRPVVYLPPSVTLTKDATTPNLWNINYGD